MYQRDVLLERALLTALNAVAVFGCALIAVWLRHATDIDPTSGSSVPWSDYVLPAALSAGIFVVFLNVYDLHRPLPTLRQEVLQILKVATLATLVVLAISFFYRGYSYSRGSVLIFFVLSIPVLMGTRRLHRHLSRRLRAGPYAGRRVAIIGFGQIGRQLGQTLLDDPAYYTLIGFLDDDPDRSFGASDRLPILGSTGDLRQIVEDRGIDEVIVAMPSASTERLQDLIGTCMEIGVRWRLVPDLAELRHERIEIDSIGGIPVVGLRGSRVVGYNWTLKRSFDLLVASVACLLLSPVMGMIALTIKATSPGPVLYQQTRVGLHGRPFTLLKFRTMQVDSEADLHQRYSTEWIFGKTGGGPSENGHRIGQLSNGGEPVHKMTEDPRVTPVGRVLRATSLDELPQLWNVLRGEMSIVGPRPPVPYEVDRYTESHKRRFEARPGITGLWQVSGRNHLSFEEMIRLDITYIENWSLREDVRIVLRTLPALVVERGR
jgi:exopolysaccharide biosynthesis polyprenyl glycosylphosphotransferase